MINNKSYIILCMYDTLRVGKPVCADECMVDYGISIATFRRYISLLRAYFLESRGLDVAYDSVKKEYRIMD